MKHFDRAQLPSPLAFNDSEFSWYIFEVEGAGRRFAGLVSIHRTGPRVRSIVPGLQLLSGSDLPAPLRDLVPSWLPIISPVRVATDDRPLFLAALYDLDARAQPIVIEHEIEHADFDADRLAATARSGDLSLRVDDGVTTIHVCDSQLSFDVTLRERKPPIVFGDGSPELRHGRIVTSYVQRPRLAVEARIGDIASLRGEGVHDHQWMRVTAPNLKWIWPHLRLPDGRELTGYVIRDSIGGRDADADSGDELGRNGWLVERDGKISKLPGFDVTATAHVTTPRGRVPVRCRVTAPELDLDLQVAHVVAAPWLRMRAFGDAIDGGIYEGPVDVEGHPAIRGWIEVMNASHVQLSAGSGPARTPRSSSSG